MVIDDPGPGEVLVDTAVAGMWTTYPARPIDGVMVSDYLPYGHGRDKPLEGLDYPDSLAETVTSLPLADNSTLKRSSMSLRASS